MSDGAEYSELGKVLDELARKRNVRGPYRVANYVRAKTGEGPNGSAWSQIFRGETEHPNPRIMLRFVEAFELTSEEEDALARVYLFRFAEAV